LVFSAPAKYNAVTVGINKPCSRLARITLFLPNWSNFKKFIIYSRGLEYNHFGNYSNCG
jgi:hypothetical protein